MSKGKTTLKTVEFTREGLSNKNSTRMVKLIACVCSSGCASLGYGWWTRCSHDPYHAMQAITDDTKRFVEQEDGSYVEDIEQTQRILYYRRVPNMRQVPATQRVDSGLAPEMQLAKGWRRPENVDPYPPDFDGEREFTGYAPMCEYQNCYKPTPTVTTTHPLISEGAPHPLFRDEMRQAAYCSENHARRARLRDSEEYVHVSGEMNRIVPAASKHARDQLERVRL